MPATTPAQADEWTPAELLFGRKTGKHSHPDTHPSWMEFTNEDCPRCSS